MSGTARVRARGDGAALMNPEPAPRRAISRIAAAIIGAVALGVLIWVYSRHTYPVFAGVIDLKLTLPAGIAGQAEPIVVTGMYGEGDLVVLKYLDDQTIAFAYDHWGSGGPSSQPIAAEPGSMHTLQVALPSLTTFRKPPPDARGSVRVVFDGREILHEALPYHGRLPKQVYFGENAIGGSAAPRFSGQVRRLNGHLIRGGPESYFTFTERALAWLFAKPLQTIGVAITSALIGLMAGWIWARPLTQAFFARTLERAPVLLPPAARHRWFIGSAAICCASFAWIVTGGTFRLNHPESFGDFYDYQAQSLLAGRLDVPEAAIGAEAFEANGKFYGYFGPTPALLRVPFVATGLAFGKLSRALMLAYYAAALVAAYLILCAAVRMTQPAAEDATAARPSRFAVVVFIGSAGLGSTLFFLGSRTFIFHEAILCGITFALWSSWCALRFFEQPQSRWWIGALVCALASLHARPPTGLFAAMLLAGVAMRHLWRGLRGRFRVRHFLVCTLCVVAVLSVNVLAYLKFGTPEIAPLRLSRPYADPNRLEHIGGKSFHAANLPFNFDAYVLRTNFRVERGFPWIYLGSKKPRRPFPQAKIDLPDFTLAFPYSMPALFALATLGGAAALVTRPSLRGPLVIVWLAALPMALALFTAVAIAQRYTGDFCPFLLCAAAFGLVAVEPSTARLRTALRLPIAALALAGIAVTTAISLHYQGQTVWGVPDETRRNYQQLRLRIDALFGRPVPRPLPALPPIETHADW